MIITDRLIKNKTVEHVKHDEFVDASDMIRYSCGTSEKRDRQ